MKVSNISGQPERDFPVRASAEMNNSRVNPKTDIRERKYNFKSEELQKRVHYLYTTQLII